MKIQIFMIVNNSDRLLLDTVMVHMINLLMHMIFLQLKRRADVEKRKKQKKIDWMKKMYVNFHCLQVFCNFILKILCACNFVKAKLKSIFLQMTPPPIHTPNIEIIEYQYLNKKYSRLFSKRWCLPAVLRSHLIQSGPMRPCYSGCGHQTNLRQRSSEYQKLTSQKFHH